MFPRLSCASYRSGAICQRLVQSKLCCHSREPSGFQYSPNQNALAQLRLMITILFSLRLKLYRILCLFIPTPRQITAPFRSQSISPVTDCSKRHLFPKNRSATPSNLTLPLTKGTIPPPHTSLFSGYSTIYKREFLLTCFLELNASTPQTISK